jgi:CubicO group peptidase (beta-lactamase class C family)
MKKQCNVALIICLLMGMLNPISAQEGHAIRTEVQPPKKYKVTYQQLKEFEGFYEYKNNTTLKIAASPIDTILLAIINESRYPLKPTDKDLFLNSGNEKIKFLRNKRKAIIGYIDGKDTFKLLDNKLKFPKEMWYPRLNVSKDSKYMYKQPSNDNDGLNVENLDKSGLNKALLDELGQKLINGTYKDVHSILVIKDGKLVFEEYFYEHNKTKLHEMRSATKSFVSALAGIAIEKGFIKSKDEKVLPYFSEYTFKNDLEAKQRISIENLLTNQSGLDCDASNPKAVGNESIMSYKEDWIQYSLDLPMVDSAGGRAMYCSSNPLILGRIIEKATKQALPEFAKQTLFKDLGIAHFYWHFKLDLSSSETYGQVNLTSRDMAKFGLLYLNKGVFNGKQVLSKDWVEQSFAKHTVVQGLDYGYLWWTKYLDADGVRYYGKLAQGNGGQKIYIFQEQNLVVVTTAGHYNVQSPINEIVAKYILPAFNKK